MRVITMILASFILFYLGSIGSYFYTVNHLVSTQSRPSVILWLELVSTLFLNGVNRVSVYVH